MNEGGRRQLPSWMMRPCTAATGVSEVKQGCKESNSEELAVAAQAQKKVKRRKHDSKVPLVVSKSRLLKKGEGRAGDRKSTPQDEDKHEDESYLLEESGTRKSKKVHKRRKDQGVDLPHGNPETDDVPTRKKHCGDNPRKKRTNKPVEDSHDETFLSEDELTVEDLVCIAEEYVNADKEPKNVLFNSEIRSSVTVIASGKDLTEHKEGGKSHTYKPPSAISISNSAISGEGSIIHPIYSGDPARDMLDLLLGGFLRRTEEAERKNNAITKNVMLDYELSNRSQIDTVAEVVPELPVTKKKVSLKDKVAMLLD